MSGDQASESLNNRDDLGALFITLANRVSIAVWICALLLICFSLYFASTLVVPLTLSLLAYLSLRPIVNVLARHHIPKWISAGLLLLSFVMLFAIGVTTVAGPAQQWVMSAPQNVDQVAAKLKAITRPLAIMDKAEEKLQEMSESESSNEPIAVEVTSPSFLNKEALMSSFGQMIAFLVGVGVITYFLLATGDELLSRLLGTLPTFGDKRQALELVHEIQNGVGRYLGQITLINVGLGVCVSIVMMFAGMPTPILWGVLATCCNFIPYVGAIIAATVIFFVAAIEFDPLWRAVATTALFLSLTSLEGQFITPSILGKTLRLGPVIVLVAVAFWGFMWGIVGIFLAVPLLIVMRLVCNAFPSTRPIAVLLGEDVADEEAAHDSTTPHSLRET